MTLFAKLRAQIRRKWSQKVYSWMLQGVPDQDEDEKRRNDIVQAQISKAHIEVGEHTYGVVRENITLGSGSERLVIGRYCSVARGVQFVFGEHPLTSVTTFPLRTLLFGNGTNVDAKEKGSIIIGSDVWIGTNAIILSGVSIGHGAVVGAGAVVTKDVPPYMVVGGVPARTIKARLRVDQIDSLLAIQWWDWSEEKIQKHLDLFYGDVDEFITRNGDDKQMPALEPKHKGNHDQSTAR